MLIAREGSSFAAQADIITTGALADDNTLALKNPTGSIVDKVGWGHSHYLFTLKLANEADVKHCILFHHEPTYDDAKLERLLDKTIRYKDKMAPDSPLEILLAWEGLTIELP